MKKIIFAIGTRPEAIKQLPVIMELRKLKEFQVYICNTGQHSRDLMTLFQEEGIDVDFDLDLLKRSKSLNDTFTNLYTSFYELLVRINPNLVFVHGDTITASTVSLVCFYNNVKVAHVEAGLRSFDLYSPWPEEFNRKLISISAYLNFCPTQASKTNLLKEGTRENSIFVTGNTVIDQLKASLIKISTSYELSGSIRTFFKENLSDDFFDNQVVIITLHRRENFSTGKQNLFEVIKDLCILYPGINFVLPLHPNPAVKHALNEAQITVSNLYVIEPLKYLNFVFLMSRSIMLITDSGGLQEEGAYLGIPVILLREETERPEGVENGNVILATTSHKKILESVSYVINENKFEYFKKLTCPFGDGQASCIISKILKDRYDDL